MQLAYTRNLVPGMPGMPAGEYNDLYIVSYPAGATIQPGIAVEVISGLVYPLKDSGTTSSFLPALIGVAMFDPAMENSYPPGSGTTPVTFGGYLVNQLVPICRKGRVWVQTDAGGTWPELGAVNVWHSSDGTHLQGVFTMSATATTAGAEIDTLLSGVVGVHAGAAGSFTDGFGQTIKTAIVELNLPGAAL
jgi:hypothetical protein